MNRNVASIRNLQSLQALQSWKTRSTLFVQLLACSVYAVLVGLTATRHEPWADEAQAWLLARDSSLWDLWTKYLHLEGTPGLWHSVLHLLIRLGMPYLALNVFSASLGFASACILIRYAPLPLLVRVLLPFTYFLAYQYSVVARSYSLTPLILFATARQFQDRRVRPIFTTVLLVLLAMVSAQAFLISLAIVVALWFWSRGAWNQQSSERRHLLAVPAAGYLVAALLIVAAVWPSSSATFVVTPNWSLANFIGITRYAFQQAFGSGYWPLIIVGLSVPLLSRGPGLFFFCLSSILMCVFGAAVYSNVWHHGFLVLAWLFAIWISCYHVPKPDWMALTALSIFVFIQCSWTYKAVIYDLKESYSGSKLAAQYLSANDLSQAKIFGIGFPTVSLQPYFSSNLYSNYLGGRDKSFWIWSKRNKTNDKGEDLGSERPEVVVLGYSSESDRKLWSDLIGRSGYKKTAHFEGNTFWETGAFQPESFEIYRPVKTPVDAVFASTLSAADANTEEQFLWGLSTPAPTRALWVGNSFGAILQRPSRLGPKQPLQLTMDFEVTPDAIRNSGPIRLTAYASGRRLPSMLLQKADAYKYVQDVRTEALYWAAIPVSFQFEKTGFAFSNRSGQHVATVTHVSLAPK